jgi:hypothetical protein
MKLSRRDLAAASAFALGAATLLESAASQAAGGDEPDVTQAVEALRKATLGRTRQSSNSWQPPS